MSGLIKHIGIGEFICMLILMPFFLPIILPFAFIERFQKLKHDTGTYFGKYFCIHKRMGPVMVDKHYSDIRHSRCLSCGCVYKA